jgi:hypothetical protein
MRDAFGHVAASCTALVDKISKYPHGLADRRHYELSDGRHKQTPCENNGPQSHCPTMVFVVCQLGTKIGRTSFDVSYARWRKLPKRS